MYLLQGKLCAKEGKLQELADILQEAAKLMQNANGCKYYIVGLANGDDVNVHVSELWQSKEDHDNSLNYPGVRELIMQAMPLLESSPEKGLEINVLGGAGI